MKFIPLPVQRILLTARLPTYGTYGSGCFDLYAAEVNGSTTEAALVEPSKPVVVDTGLAFAIPEGYVMTIRSRSGLWFKGGVASFPGEIDSDYRGTVKIGISRPLEVGDSKSAIIKPGDRICQARLVESPRAVFQEVDELPPTLRGENGFGSTGT